MCLRVHLSLGLHILLIGLSSALTAYYDVLLVDDHDILDLATGCFARYSCDIRPLFLLLLRLLLLLLLILSLRVMRSMFLLLTCERLTRLSHRRRHAHTHAASPLLCLVYDTLR